MTVALAASYFSVMGAKCALPAVLSLLTAPSTGLTFPTSTSLMPQQLMARQLTCATLAVAAGKLLLGPLIDHFGGVLSLQIALCLLAFLLMVISLGQSFFLFSIAWIAVDFIFSSCWAACINAIRQVFPVDEWPDQIATLAAAARTGNASAFAVFAAILHFFERRGMRQAWRPVFAVSAVAQLIPVALLAYFGRSTKTRDAATGGSDSASHTSPKAFTQQEQRQQQEAHDSKPSFRASLSTVWRLAETPDFWLHLVSRSVLMVFASFLLFVPTLMTEVYATSPSFGAQAGSLYALGCLLSVTVAAPFYSRISRKSRASHLLWITGLLLFGATGSSLAQLGHVNGRWILSSAASAVLLFAWGFSFAIPFYLPPSLYALRRGGHESSATIADIFDIGGFALLAAFNGYVAGIQQSIPGAWVPTFQITTFCSLISFLSLSIVAWREGENQ
jgi:sugar phosphate permease